jgi:lipoprotein-releasing system permease protein
MYETTIGLKYLYRGKPHRPALIGLAAAIVVTLLGGYAFLSTGKPSPIGVFALGLGSIATVFFALLSFFSVITTVSVTGVVLGVAAVTIILAVTSGFQKQFREKVLGVNAHILVMKRSNDFSAYREIEEVARAIKPDVLAVQPFIFVEMLMTRGKGEVAGILMKGIDPARVGDVLDLPKHMIEGDVGVLSPSPDQGGGPPPVILGRELAVKLKAKVGDKVTLVLPNLQGDFRTWSSQPPRRRDFMVRGIFYAGFGEYDQRLAYVNLREAQDLLGEGDVVTGVEMRIANVDRARAIAEQLREQLGDDPYVVLDWRELNNNLFTALVIQKVVLLVLLMLIIVVATFNIVAALTMLVVDRTKEIAILKSMGTTSFGVARIFQVVGLTIGVVGTVLGVGLGLLLCAATAKYGYPLDPKVYLIDQLPIVVQTEEVIWIAVGTMIVCFVATLFPSLKASALRPVEGLRYE